MKDKFTQYIGLIPAALVVTLASISLGTYTAPKYEVATAETVAQDQEETEKETEKTTAKVTTEPAPTVELVSEDVTYKDGTYTGTGKGYNGNTKVEVVIKDGKIQSITVLSTQDDEPFFTNAKALLDNILSKQSTNVDTVSGATFSSVGLINAVRDALSQAGGEEVALETTETKKSTTKNTEAVSISAVQEADSYTDGIYTGSAQGYGGLTTVQVTVSNGKIADVKILSHHDDSPYITNASTLTSRIVQAQSTNVDTVSGATYSSAGIINAVRNALIQAGKVEDTPIVTLAPVEHKTTTTRTTTSTAPLKIIENGYTYADGTFEGTGEGFKSDITVSVTIKNHKIQTVKVLSEGDDPAYFSKASVLCENVVKKQNANIDVISGATFSSCGILDAVSDALNQSYQKALSEQGSTTTSKATTTTTTTTTAAVTTPLVIDDTLLNGTFTGTAICYPDDNEDFYEYTLSVSLTFENGVLKTIDEITGTGDDYDTDNDFYINRAANGTSKLEGVVSQIITKQSTEEIDAISGATCSSDALTEAVKNAWEQATESTESSEKE